MSEKTGFFTNCGAWWMKGQSDDGSEYAKKVDCGREWCLNCAERTKMRRFSRCLEKAQKIWSMGYLVVTRPEDDQPRTIEALKADRKALFDALEMWGISRYFGRSHWFGKEPGKLHIHDNVLFEGGWFEPDEFESFKNTIRYQMGLPDNADVYYQFSTETRWKIHKLKYINRNTFLNPGWDSELAEEIVNFKNSFSRGNVRHYTGEVGVDKNGKEYRKYEMKWEGSDVWGLDDNDNEICGYVLKIQRGISPLSGEKIRWGRVCKEEDLPDDYEKIWDGIYQKNPSAEVVMRYQVMKDLQRALRSPPIEARA
jgi:hypothetical protein